MLTYPIITLRYDALLGVDARFLSLRHFIAGRARCDILGID